MKPLHEGALVQRYSIFSSLLCLHLEVICGQTSLFWLKHLGRWLVSLKSFFFFSLSLSPSFPLIVMSGFCCCGRGCCGFDGQLGFWPCRLQWSYGCCRWCHWAMLLQSLKCTGSQAFSPVATNSASHRPDIACPPTDPMDSRVYPCNANMINMVDNLL